MTEVLRDVLEPGMRVVFCGTAAGTASARARAYYAGPGNTIGGATVWVLPSTSGAARRYWTISPWEELARSLEA